MSNNYLYYCKKCGRIIFFLNSENDKLCDCCKSEVYPIPEKYKGKGDYKIYQNDLWNKYVKTSQEFDPYLFEHRDEILAKQLAEFNAALEHGRHSLVFNALTVIRQTPRKYLRCLKLVI